VSCLYRRQDIDPKIKKKKEGLKRAVPALLFGEQLF
jgi:hypothetical protein